MIEPVTLTNNNLFSGVISGSSSIFERYRIKKISRVVLLCSDEECTRIAGHKLQTTLKEHGFKVTSFPIHPHEVPTGNAYEQLVAKIAQKCRNNKKVLVLGDGDIRGTLFTQDVRSKLLNKTLEKSAASFIESNYSPIELFYKQIKTVPDTENRLLRTCMPGRYAYSEKTKKVEQTIQSFKDRHVEVIVLLCSEMECEMKSGVNLKKRYLDEGFEVIHFPLVDHSIIKETTEFKLFIKQIASRHRSGKTILIHCSAGVERTGEVVAHVHANLTGQRLYDSKQKTRDTYEADKPDKNPPGKPTELLPEVGHSLEKPYLQAKAESRELHPIRVFDHTGNDFFQAEMTGKKASNRTRAIDAVENRLALYTRQKVNTIALVNQVEAPLTRFMDIRQSYENANFGVINFNIPSAGFPPPGPFKQAVFQLTNAFLESNVVIECDEQDERRFLIFGALLMNLEGLSVIQAANKLGFRDVPQEAMKFLSSLSFDADQEPAIQTQPQKNMFDKVKDAFRFLWS